ncbi:MAG: pyridoxal-phosphate dependent enzyme [Phycisphaeraceae bacterium]|nr:pyridoxal-phosphate dependent enzyme [Phycisphaeraceae bacterium]MCW5753908.1 pyridoxal-phosphate dependent enzyme [Phycisphaeraceae bacterium]
MEYKNTILDAVGNTPLVRLNKVVPAGGATVLAKCEFMNPAGSVKDRMAMYIIQEAEKRGELRPGGTIVENTSGNTGLGVAMAAAVKGYKAVFTMPDKMSLEKINMLKSFGAEVIITPTDVPGDSPDHYVNVAKRVAQERNAFYLNQYHNALNIEAHERLTGPEIWRQTEGKVDAVVAGAGTGGTISGIGRYLKSINAHTRVVGVDILGSVHYHYFYTGTLPTAYVYKVEGIGEDIKCDAFDPKAIDEMRQVDDYQSFHMARRLVREEGLFCGGSSGSAAHVAVELAAEMGPGKTIVVILPDSGTRYITKFLADSWMRDHGFLEPERGLGLVEDVLKGMSREVVSAREDEPVGAVVDRMRSAGVSQVPVLDGASVPRLIVHEIDVLRGLQSGKISSQSPIRAVANPIGGLVYPKARVEELYPIFNQDKVAVVVDASKLVGIIAQIDLIEYLSRRGR